MTASALLPGRRRLALVDRAPDEPPLAPSGVAAIGGRACTALVDALLALDDERLRLLRGVCGADVAVVVGAPEALPWLEGVRWLGEAAPGLWLPTTRAPSVAAALAAAAVGAHLPAALLDLDGATSLVPLRAALPLSRAGLARGAVPPGGGA